MCVWRRLSGIALVGLTLSPLSAAVTPSDQAVAERVLGPQWKHFVRRAGMIFTGTVLSTGPLLAQTTTSSDAPANLRLGGDFIELRFRIDRPIEGVESGQILTVREWTGACSRQPALRSGERVLLLLYPPSRLGLTSPVGGTQGQIRLDSTGENVVERARQSKSRNEPGQDSPAAANVSGVRPRILVSQIERAIRRARGESR